MQFEHGNVNEQACWRKQIQEQSLHVVIMFAPCIKFNLLLVKCDLVKLIAKVINNF